MKRILFALLACITATSVFAATDTLKGSSDLVDAAIYHASGADSVNNYGSTQQPLMNKFDQRGILIKPIAGRVAALLGTGKTIDACSLIVTLTNDPNTANDSLRMRQLKKNWTVGNANGVAVASGGDSCTWMKARASGGSDVLWGTAGAQNTSTDISATNIDKVPMGSAGTANVTYRLNIGASIATSWYDGSNDTTGVRLSGTLSNVFGMYTTDYTTTDAYRPRIFFVYHTTSTETAITIKGGVLKGGYLK